MVWWGLPKLVLLSNGVKHSLKPIFDKIFSFGENEELVESLRFFVMPPVDCRMVLVKVLGVCKGLCFGDCCWVNLLLPRGNTKLFAERDWKFERQTSELTPFSIMTTKKFFCKTQEK